MTLEQVSFLLRCGNAVKEMIGGINAEQTQTACIQMAANAMGKVEVLCGELDIMRQELVPVEESVESMTDPDIRFSTDAADADFRPVDDIEVASHYDAESAEYYAEARPKSMEEYDAGYQE